MRISADTLLHTVVDKNPEAMQLLARHGFYGLSCAVENWLPIWVIMSERGILIEPLLADLNSVFADQEF